MINSACISCEHFKWIRRSIKAGCEGDRTVLNFLAETNSETKRFVWLIVAAKFFEGFGEVLFREFIIGREPVSTVHYTEPGPSIK